MPTAAPPHRPPAAASGAAEPASATTPGRQPVTPSAAPSVAPPAPTSSSAIVEPPPNPRYLVLLDGDEAGASAAATALVGALLAAGAPVVDPARAEAIRRNEQDMAAARGGDAARLAAIGRQAGADVVVTGRVSGEAQPGLGRFFTGRAAADLRTYDASTGSYLGAQTVRVGAGGEAGKLAPSETEAKSVAAEEVGRRGAAAVLAQVAAKVGGPQEIRAEVYGVASLAEVEQMRAAIGSLAGVRAVYERSFEATARALLGIDYAGSPAALRAQLDGLAVGGRHLRVTGSENGRLTLELK